MAKKSTKAGEALANHLRELGLAKYPGAHLKSPWPGHLDLAVKDKTFAYLSPPGERFSISCKLPRSNAVALMMPNTQPTGYGLGKSGWVSASYDDDDELPPAEIFEAWIDESYRAQAPKKLVAQLDAAAAGAPGAAKAAARNGAAKKAGAKKTSAKKAGAKKTSAKKTSAKKAATTRTAAKGAKGATRARRA